MNIIINELLLYAKHHLDHATLDNIKKMIMHFYGDDEIVDAKKALWAKKSDILGVYPERKSTGTRHARIPNVSDIFDALKKLDAANEMPRIVAEDLNRIPDRQPEELNLMTVIDRVAQLERTLSKHDETLSSLAIDILEIKERPKTFTEALNSKSTKKDNSEQTKEEDCQTSPPKEGKHINQTSVQNKSNNESKKQLQQKKQQNNSSVRAKQGSNNPMGKMQQSRQQQPTSAKSDHRKLNRDAPAGAVACSWGAPTPASRPPAPRRKEPDEGGWYTVENRRHSGQGARDDVTDLLVHLLR